MKKIFFLIILSLNVSLFSDEIKDSREPIDDLPESLRISIYEELSCNAFCITQDNFLKRSKPKTSYSDHLTEEYRWAKDNKFDALRLAEQNDSKIQFILSILYKYGVADFEESPSEAERWEKRSRELNFPYAIITSENPFELMSLASDEEQDALLRSYAYYKLHLMQKHNIEINYGRMNLSFPTKQSQYGVYYFFPESYFTSFHNTDKPYLIKYNGSFPDDGKLFHNDENIISKKGQYLLNRFFWLSNFNGFLKKAYEIYPRTFAYHYAVSIFEVVNKTFSSGKVEALLDVLETGALSGDPRCCLALAHIYTSQQFLDTNYKAALLYYYQYLYTNDFRKSDDDNTVTMARFGLPDIEKNKQHSISKFADYKPYENIPYCEFGKIPNGLTLEGSKQQNKAIHVKICDAIRSDSIITDVNLLQDNLAIPYYLINEEKILNAISESANWEAKLLALKENLNLSNPARDTNLSMLIDKKKEQIQRQIEKRKKTQLEEVYKNLGITFLLIVVFLILIFSISSLIRKISKTVKKPRPCIKSRCDLILKSIRRFIYISYGVIIYFDLDELLDAFTGYSYRGLGIIFYITPLIIYLMLRWLIRGYSNDADQLEANLKEQDD